MEFAALIRRALEAVPIYAIIALLLALFVFRWNVNRVRYTTDAITPPC